ncbi:prephenate dehydratase domain-containing protein [Streptomyces olivaceoviridis]
MRYSQGRCCRLSTARPSGSAEERENCRVSGRTCSTPASAANSLYATSGEPPCTSFSQALDAVILGDADVAVIPVNNCAAGRVADVHHLLPDSGLHIVAEYFLPVRFDLMGVAGGTLDQVECVRSHVHALGQCRELLRESSWGTLVSDDTAGAAREAAEATRATRLPPRRPGSRR